MKTQQQTQERCLTVPPFSVHVVKDRFVEIHFDDGVQPPEETDKYIKDHGFRFYRNCDRRPEPRYGAIQSIPSWEFALRFNAEYGHEDIPPGAIPEEYRYLHSLIDEDQEPFIPVVAPIAPPPPEPVMTKTKTAPGQLDFMSMFEDIFAIANDAVAELDEAAQRRAKLLAELEKWKDWKPSAPCNLMTMLKLKAAIAMMMTGAAYALFAESCKNPNYVAMAIEVHNRRDQEEGESLKKHEPLLLPELPPESTVEVEAHVETTTETQPGPIESPEEPQLILTAPSSEEPIKPAKKKKTAAPKVYSKLPKPRLGGDAYWLDDEELVGTEPYIGCYAVLDGRVGLSFKGLAYALPMIAYVDRYAIKRVRQPMPVAPWTAKRCGYAESLPPAIAKTTVAKEFIAQPGTFQPLELEGWVRDRITGLIAVWDASSRLIESEADPSLDAETVERYREELNLVYDDFVVSHGYINQNKKLTKFCDNTDARLFMLLALEVEDSETGLYDKASIFHSRQQYPVKPPTKQFYFDDDPMERCRLAYIKCLDECGLRFDLELTATLAGLDPEDVEANLLELGIIYRDPIVDEDE